MGQESRDISAETQAQQAGPGWMSTLGKGIGLLGGAAKIAGGFGLPGFGGF